MKSKYGAIGFLYALSIAIEGAGDALCNESMFIGSETEMTKLAIKYGKRGKVLIKIAQKIASLNNRINVSNKYPWN